MFDGLQDGCQITDKAAASILAEIQSFGYFDPDLQDQKGRLRQIPEDPGGHV